MTAETNARRRRAARRRLAARAWPALLAVFSWVCGAAVGALWAWPAAR